MDNGYWNKTLASRLSRRRALAATGAAGLGAAFLAACGGDDKGPRQEASGLVTKKVDTSKEAKAGGAIKLQQTSDTPTLDVISGAVASLSTVTPYAYSRLTMMKPGYMQKADGSVIPDAAEAMEWSPDGLQLTFRIRQNVKFHNLAPVNGRTLDVEDILYSWGRFAEKGVLRSELANSVNPAAPIASVTAPDSRTIVIKLAAPYVDLPILLSTGNSGQFHMIPKEAESGFDLRQRMIGTGPWSLSEYQPSVRFVFRKHPQYHLGEGARPYAETVELPIVGEYAQNLAQFKAGSIYHYASLRAEDLLPTKRDLPNIDLTQAWTDASIGQRTIFGYRPAPPDETPFRDERLRQAYSMSWDRDLFIDVVYEVTKLNQEGLPVSTAWNSTELQNNFFAGWWLDPKGKDFGDNARLFKHNPAEAKKLVAAAGFPNGVNVISSHFTTTQYGVDFPRHVELLEGMSTDVGINFKKNIVDYNVDFFPKYRDAKGNHEGLSYKLGPSGGGDSAVGRLIFFTHSTGGGFTGFDPDGRGTHKGDPWIDQSLDKARGELDVNKRKALVQEVQRYMAKRMYSVRWPGGASQYRLSWPALQNFELYDTISGAARYLYEWVDQTKPPFRSS